jgi:hypothetical protein
MHGGKFVSYYRNLFIYLFIYFHKFDLGIWSLCINLKEMEIMQLRPKGFPKVNLCYNYLTDASDSSKNENFKLSDWQHIESQTSLQPHLSKIDFFFNQLETNLNT